MGLQDMRTLQAAYPQRFGFDSFSKQERHGVVGRGCRALAVRTVLPAPASQRDAAVVISWRTPERVGSLQCADVLQAHGLPTLQASEGNVWRHLRSQVSHLKIPNWGSLSTLRGCAHLRLQP